MRFAERVHCSSLLLCNVCFFGQESHLREVIAILLLQNRKYLGCTVHTHQIAIHPKINEGLPGIVKVVQSLSYNKFALQTTKVCQLPCHESCALLVNLKEKSSGKECR